MPKTRLNAPNYRFSRKASVTNLFRMFSYPSPGVRKKGEKKRMSLTRSMGSNKGSVGTRSHGVDALTRTLNNFPLVFFVRTEPFPSPPSAAAAKQQ